MTDPEGWTDGAWWAKNGDEMADLCEYDTPRNTVLNDGVVWAVQPFWDNKVGCSMAAVGTAPPHTLAPGPPPKYKQCSNFLIPFDDSCCPDNSSGSCPPGTKCCGNYYCCASLKCTASGTCG